MSKELLLILAAIIFLAIAVYTIKEIAKLNMARSHKVILYWITAILPVLGLYLLIKAKRKA